AQGPGRLALLLEIAWHARQRDTLRAKGMLIEARALCESETLIPALRQATLARIELTEGEIRWLFAEIDLAQALANQALVRYMQLEDAVGCSDAHALLAVLMGERGEPVLRDQHREQAVHFARQGSDSLRADISEAAIALWAVFQDVNFAQERWAARFAAAATDAHPALSVWLHGFIGMLAFQKADIAPTVEHLLKSFNSAALTGQLQRQIIAATNLGVAFGNLNDPQTAMEWMQRGLEVARHTAWPSSLGLALVQTASTQRLLGRFDAAQSLLEEAIQVLEPLRGGRNYALALDYLGEVAFGRKDYAAALSAYAQLEERAKILNQTDLQNVAQRGQAGALAHLNRQHEARVLGERALAEARTQKLPINQFDTLMVLAEIYAAHDTLPPPPDMVQANGALHYLQLALEIGKTMDGFTVPANLYDAMAREYSKAGDGERAYEIALQSIAAREKINTADAVNRSIAMQITHQTERALAEGEHHRQLAAAEASRAATLQQTGETLEHLSAVGQEITAQLDAQAIFGVLDRHVHRLLDDSSLIIFLMNEDQQSLKLAFGVKADSSFATQNIALANAQSNSARCVRECSEILIEYEHDSVQPNHIPGTLRTLSQLFVPLKIGNRVLGVMTIQSPQFHAYAEREQLIFRNLCAYGAIALDNAAAYRQLEATLKTLHAIQAELIEKNLALEEAYREQEEASLTDPLTGLRNRRFLMQHIETDIAMALRQHDKRQSQPGTHPKANTDLLFFMIDLDHFKAVNDTYGHAAGDMVLVQMRERLQSVARESDYIIRWGGEEFLLVAHATNRQEGHVIAERIRVAVADLPCELGSGQQLQRTCSVGFAS
ncbi:MAG: diguanylate cyclase, partial [Rhodoferax sp.]